MEKLKITKTSINKILKWTSSRYNTRKVDAVSTAYEVLKAGEGKIILWSGVYTDGGSANCGSYLVDGDEGVILLGRDNGTVNCGETVEDYSKFEITETIYFAKETK